MKILITGSNGLLGQKLVNILSNDAEVELIASSRGKNRLHNTDNYQYLSLDITDKAAVINAFQEIKPDVLIHTAAMTNVDQCETEKEDCWLQNVEAVSNLIAAAEIHDTFFMHLSTDFIFDGKAGPYKEEAEANPISFYGWSKYAAEKLFQNTKISYSIARTVLVYGIAEDMSRSNIILWVKNSLENNKPIKVVNDQWRTPTLAEDLAIGCVLIAKKKASGIFNISGKDFLNPFQMASMTADYFNLDKTLISEVDGSSFSQTAQRPAITGFDLSKAREILAYEPRSFEEGIEILAKQIAS